MKGLTTAMLAYFQSPSSLLILLWTAGVLWLFLKRQSRAARSIVLIASAILLIALWTPLAAWVAAPLQNRYPAADQAALERTSLLVHLSGAERPHLASHAGDLRLNDQFGRYFEMLRVAHLVPDSPIVFSGGYTTDTATDIEIAAQLYNSLDLTQRTTFLGGAENTCGNAREVKSYMAAKGTDGPVALVTSAAHMPRAVLCFQAYGISVVPAPAPPISNSRANMRIWVADPLDTAKLRLLDLAAHEWLGIVYYRLSGKTNGLWPKRSSPDGGSS